MSIGLKSDSSGTSGSIVINGSDKVVVTSAGNVTAGTFTGALTGSLTAGGSLTSGVAVASTSGTAIDFTSIPSWAKRITVMLNGVSTSGISNIVLRLGTSSGIVSTGYVNTMNALYSSILVFQNSTGFSVLIPAAADTHGGTVTISSFGSSNTWTVSGVVAASGAIAFTTSGYSPNLGGALDRIRLTMANGTDTFDGGSFNIMYEG
jgi:hypothetical protein